jgi:PAS domain S-box-containing protein
MDKEYEFDNNQIIVSKTDTKGKLTYCNEIFIRMSAYTEQELLGQPHNILRHQDMPKVIFKLLWETIQSGQEIDAYVKNLRKDGGYYWVLANVTPSFDKNNRIIGHFSVRRKPKKSSLEYIKNLYSKLIQLERAGGTTASMKHLQNILDEKEVSYAEFVLSC